MTHAEQLTLEPPDAQSALPGFLTCQRCHVADEDVISYVAWIGGVGYERVTHCVDCDACWARVEAAAR